MKILYIDSCIRGEHSRTKRLADVFMKEVIRRYPQAEVTCRTLMDEPISAFNQNLLAARDSLIMEGKLDEKRFFYAHEFAQADKIVIAAPFWDLGFPALLKIYIENISVDGITFGCNDQGMYGLCKADHMVFLTTRGGIYGDGPMEMGSRYLEALCKMYGIDRYDCIAAEGIDLVGFDVEKEMEEAYKKAVKMADI